MSESESSLRPATHLTTSVIVTSPRNDPSSPITTSLLILDSIIFFAASPTLMSIEVEMRGELITSLTWTFPGSRLSAVTFLRMSLSVTMPMGTHTPDILLKHRLQGIKDCGFGPYLVHHLDYQPSYLVVHRQDSGHSFLRLGVAAISVISASRRPFLAALRASWSSFEQTITTLCFIGSSS